MENIKHVPLALLALYLTKLAIFGASLPDGIVIAAICALIAYSAKQDKEEQLKEVNLLLKANQEALEKHSRELSEIRTHIAGNKLGAQFRSVTGGK